MEKAFAGFDKLYSVGVSPWVQHRAEQSLIFKDAVHTTVLNGLDTKIFTPQSGTDELRKKYSSKDSDKVIIHVTASFESPTKGGKYIIELAKRLGNDYKVIVIGNKETPADLPENIIAVGRVENQVELARYYTMADLCVVTGLRETFSMPIAEGMCCGTPAVGFLAGGPESIAIERYSEFVECGNVEELERAVRAMLKRGFARKIFSERAKELYSKENMCKNYIKIYEELVKE
jgi:glycosyltransferase involved in cell wall biosynthesis